MFWKSKTFWFNVLALVVAIVSNFGYTGELPANWAVFLPAIVALINVILGYIGNRRGQVV